MAALKLMEKIDVQANGELCEIQLLFGSVTKLTKEDEVDVLVVSAFPDAYHPTQNSVIGALHRDLDISIKALSKDKEEDLRSLFFCWWSKPLPDDYAFRKILCFEGGFKTSSRPPKVVSEVFRCLVSGKQQNMKVMMPLLAAGGQGYSESLMLRLIVEAAIHWMQIGLPLKNLKIVVYEENLERVLENPLLEFFKGLKQTWTAFMEKERQKPVGYPINYDVYLSYSETDKRIADKIEKCLADTHESIRIFSDHQNINPAESWQEEIYKVMVTCARVITILTPRFLADEACLEQYNIALCCTRNMKRDYLAPFYVDSIDEMPTYMSLIQYVDCRPCDDEKMADACLAVNNWLQTHLHEPVTLCPSEKAALSQPRRQCKVLYDVFISYSHRNTDAAHRINKHLALFHPDWNIFIDVCELKTGVAWQTKLYESIESSGIIITLLSPAYLASKVCQEEYNLAAAMHFDASYGTLLFPMLVEQINKLPSWCESIAPIDCTNISDGALGDVLKKMELIYTLQTMEKPSCLSIEKVTSDWRSEHFLSSFACLPNVTMADIEAFSSSEQACCNTEVESIDIVLSYHPTDQRYGEFLLRRLNHYYPNLRISIPQESTVRTKLIDEASITISLLSFESTESPKVTEELNTALCRQRFGDNLVFFPIFLENITSAAMHFRLLFCLFQCTDEIWTQEATKFSNSIFFGSEKCLDVAACFIGFILFHKSLFNRSFKTLLSIEELLQSTLRFRSENPTSAANPLHF